MIHKVLIIISLIISLSSDIWGAAVVKNVKSPPPSKNSILNDILTEIKTNNSEICPTPREILESDYVKECDKLSFPPANTPLKAENNYNTFLCLALYDRAYHICHTGSRDFKIPALQNKSAFDALIADEIMHHQMDAYKVCELLGNASAALFKKTKSFVDELSVALKNPPKCVSICWDEKLSKTNPLCLVIQVIDEEIKKAAVEGTGEKKDKISVKITEAQPTNGVTQAATNPKSPPSASDTGHGEVKNSNDHKSSPVNTNPQTADKKVDESKPKPGSEVVSKVGKDNAPTPEQSPPVSDDKVKKMELPKKDAVVPKDENSPSQMVAPEDDAVGKEVEKSTVSENTGGDGGDAGLGNDESIDAEMAGPLDDDEPIPPLEDPANQGQKSRESLEQPNNLPKLSHITSDDDSHFFGYFTLFGLFGIGLFAAYHHKHKIFAILLEGRRSRGGRGRRRPSTANYRKLDCTLEEAVTSQCSSNVPNVIY